jgi:hypothetical protein
MCQKGIVLESICIFPQRTFANTSVRARCRKCKRAIPHLKFCPSCGSEERDVIGQVDERVQIMENIMRVRDWLEVNVRYLIPTIAVTMGSPVVGYFLHPFAGMLLGLAAGSVSLWIGASAVTKVKEIAKEQSRV